MMKQIAIVILLGISCSNSSTEKNFLVDNKVNLNEILGTWKYSHSRNNNLQLLLETNNICPTNKMEFVNMNIQQIKIKYKNVKDNRAKSNILESIILKTFNNNDKIIDEYMPIVEKINTKYELTNYGIKYKFHFYILKLNKDSLVISNGKIWTVNNVKLYNTEHIYIRH
jgi:hypothetical protein